MGSALLRTGLRLVVRRARAEPLVVAAAALSFLLATTLVAAIPLYSEAVALAGLHRRLEAAPPAETQIRIAFSLGDEDTAAALDADVRAEVGEALRGVGGAVDRTGSGDRLTWQVTLDFDELSGGEIERVRARVARLEDRLNEARRGGRRFAVYTSLDGMLAEADDSLAVARAGVLVSSAQVAVLAAYALLFTAALVVERRTRASETLRLRGASTGQLFAVALLEAAVLAIPVVLVAPWLAALAIRALARAGPLGEAGLSLEPRVSAAAYALAALAAAGSVLALALPVLRVRRPTASAGRGRGPAASLVQRARLDLALVAFAAIAYWQLRRYRDPFVEQGGGLGIDPFLVLAPALCLLAGAVIVLRLVPLLARGADRVAGGVSGLAVSLAPRELSRRPGRWMRAALLLTLAVAIGVFAAVYGESWRAAQAARAAEEAAADVRVVPSRRTGALPAAGLSAAYRGLEGVTAVIPVSREQLDFERATGELVALDAGQGALTLQVSDRLAAALGRLEPRGEPLPSAPLPDGRLVADIQTLGATIHDERFRGLENPLRGLEAELSLLVVDRHGSVREVPLGRLPTDGSAARLRVPLGGDAWEPARPLRLAGFRLSMRPLYYVDLTVRVSVSGLPVGGHEWQLSFETPADTYTEPRDLGAEASAEGLSATLRTGSHAGTFFRRRRVEALLVPRGQAVPSEVPALASDELLARTRARPGQVLELSLAGGTRRVRIVGAFTSFPGIRSDATALVVDFATFAALRLSRQRAATEATEWWLETTGAGSVAARLRSPPFASELVVDRSTRRRELLADPIALGHLGALLLGVLAAAGFAVVGFALSSFAALRGRAVHVAVLRALGLRRRELGAWLALELALIAALTLVAGTALGLVTAWSVLPFLALAGGEGGLAGGVVVPWEDLLAFDAVLVAALLGIVLLELRLARRLDVVAALRAGEERAA